MLQYITRRLLLLPLTLFCIVLVNFGIINLAPGEPTTATEISQQGGAERQETASGTFGSNLRYLQFREHFGLTLPVFFNLWPTISSSEVENKLKVLTFEKDVIPFSEYSEIKIRFGDQARFIMPKLEAVFTNPKEDEKIRTTAADYFIRGGLKQAYLGTYLSEAQKAYNKKIAKDNQYLIEQLMTSKEPLQEKEKKFFLLSQWYKKNAVYYNFEPDFWDKVEIFFFETRFYRYMSRVLTLDFGTIRNDTNKTVISEVTKRFKYSLTLAIVPMILTFFLCLILGFTMALWQYKWPDYSVNLLCLTLYAIPVFVVAPFLIEEVALNHTFPFTNTSIPISGFTSPEAIYANLTTSERLLDIIQHITLPITAIIYGSLAAQSRLARTAVLEVMRQDYVRTARAKGVAPMSVNLKHIGRNAAITIVTAIAGSLGVILGGSLIVETVFEINGFGKFFYDAVVNRDYNVIMFSALAGSFLTLMGYLVADITYTLLDPRVTLD